MEIYKRKIYLESLTSRKEGINYGIMTADTFNINFFLKQTIDDMGMFTDSPNIDEPVTYPLSIGGSPNINNPLISKLIESGYTFDFMYNESITPTPPDVTDYYFYGDKISAHTSSRLPELKKYDINNPYEEMFLFNVNSYINFDGDLIPNTVSTIIDLGNTTAYTFDALNDANIGTDGQTTGLLFRDTGENIENEDDELNITIERPETIMSYIGQGWNMTNISLSALSKNEMYFGLTSEPEVESEVFIERGNNSILESHLRLSEIENLTHLENYNNGNYYNINKQTL